MPIAGRSDVGDPDVGEPDVGSEPDGAVVGVGAIVTLPEVLVTLPSLSVLWSVTS